MPLPEKLKHKLLTPVKLQPKLLTPSRMQTETDGRMDRRNNICPFYHSSNGGGRGGGDKNMYT